MRTPPPHYLDILRQFDALGEATCGQVTTGSTGQTIGCRLKNTGYLIVARTTDAVMVGRGPRQNVYRLTEQGKAALTGQQEDRRAPEPMTGVVLRSPCVHHWIVGPMEGPILHEHHTCTKCSAEKVLRVSINGDTLYRKFAVAARTPEWQKWLE